MRDDTSEDLEHLVLRIYPDAWTTFQLANQFEEHLPIRSQKAFAELLKQMRLSVDDAQFEPEQVAAIIPKEVFPINDRADLVAKIAAAIRVGIDVMRRADRAPSSDALTSLAVSIAASQAGASSPVATAFFGFVGPSLFGAERAAKE